MGIIDEVRTRLSDDWLPIIYLNKVRSQRTRSFLMDIPERENAPEILHTLLGIELKVGKRRMACPDLATARYLFVFATVGCGKVAVPYDITKISTLADELETALHRTLLVADELTTGKPTSAIKRNRTALFREIRDELSEIGAGEVMPEFSRTTKMNKA